MWTRGKQGRSRVGSGNSSSSSSTSTNGVENNSSSSNNNQNSSFHKASSLARNCGSVATPPTICWFRDFDLRLVDNAALTEAVRRGNPVIPCFVWPQQQDKWAPGGAARAWLERSLAYLNECLMAKGSFLTLRHSSTDCATELVKLADECGAKSVFFHKSYTTEGTEEEYTVSQVLDSCGIEAVPFAGHLLYEPEAVKFLHEGYSGGHWGTLIPFLQACRRSGPPPSSPLPVPKGNIKAPKTWPDSASLSSLELAPRPMKKDGSGKLGWHWAKSMMAHWEVGEAAAERVMNDFVNSGLAKYETERSRADKPGTVSTLSPYLRFGQLSARQLYHAIRSAGLQQDLIKTFSRRLHWRDLSYYHMSCFPSMSDQPIRSHYAAHWWNTDKEFLRAWQKGRTGYPMVDAGMRCLWATGWMHQSVRMIVASFLVEYMGVSWVEGAKWFHDTLVDADVAINAMMWQNAGRSGVDQWNFVNSPETGSQDRTGDFCRKWVPELRKMPTKFIHTPWLAPPEVLAGSGVKLGVNYPERIVKDLAGARKVTVQAALEARRSAMHLNNEGGYDMVQLPSGNLAMVFTKQEFRLLPNGQVKERFARVGGTAVVKSVSSKQPREAPAPADPSQQTLEQLMAKSEAEKKRKARSGVGTGNQPIEISDSPSPVSGVSPATTGLGGVVGQHPVQQILQSAPPSVPPQFLTKKNLPPGRKGNNSCSPEVVITGSRPAGAGASAAAGKKKKNRLQ